MPRKKKAQRPTGGDWNLDLWGGAGMEREGRTRAEQLELARDEMRRSGSRDLFDFLADQDKQHNPPRGDRRDWQASEWLAYMQGRKAYNVGRSVESCPFIGRLRQAWHAGYGDARKTSRAPNPRQIGGGRFRVSHVSPHDPSWQVWDDFLKRYAGQRRFTRREAEQYARELSARAKRFAEPNPGDTPERRYQRAVGHGERVATARTAAANPGRAVGRMAPNCPMCGALVRLSNPVPATVTCHNCGSASTVRRP